MVQGTGGYSAAMCTASSTTTSCAASSCGMSLEERGVSLPESGGSFSQDAEFDKLAYLVKASLDMDAVYESMGMRAGRAMQIPR